MSVSIRTGDCIELMREMPAESVHTCVTSPPYFGLRDYGHEGQIGLEDTPDAFVSKLVDVFREVRRVLRDDGTVWLNLGDSYEGARAGDQGKDGQMANRSVAAARCRVRGNTRRSGLKNKDLIGIPWMVAFALRADGWYLRQDIIWHKPNPMPESVRDRCTKAHEYIFLLSKGPRYYFDAEAIAESAVGAVGGVPVKIHDDRAQGRHGSTSTFNTGWTTPAETRNRRSVWTVATQPYSGAHFATFPPDLIEPCIKAGSPYQGTVLDPFGGAGTTALVADRLGRNAILCELNPTYAELARDRVSQDAGLFWEAAE